MLDIKELQQAMADMRPRQKLYEVIKQEMQARGRWRLKPRGQPFKPIDKK